MSPAMPDTAQVSEPQPCNTLAPDCAVLSLTTAWQGCWKRAVSSVMADLPGRRDMSPCNR